MEKIIICTYDEKLLPEKKTSGAVCWDMKASVDFEVNPGEVELVSAGFKTHLPIGWQSKVYARSSMPTKANLILANSTAIFDADYRGEYMMQFLNYTKDMVKHEKYTRLCQIEFLPYFIGSGEFGTQMVPEIEFVVDKDLFDDFEKRFSSGRGEGRIGSTGNQ